MRELSPMQEAIVRAAARGERTRDMAHHWDVSMETIRTQRQVVLRKLRASSMAHAVAIYLRSNDE